ncbi:MAG: cell envelope integrity protein TolA [Bacilli bacterium]|nr:cell envelope integrity protein TolA [Bacilli bacterium]
MRVKDDLDRYFESLNNILAKNEAENAFPEYFYNSFLAGKNNLYRKELSETKVFDEEWIGTLESYFPSIDKIIKNPKSTIRYDREVVDIERAKKTNAESVRHLASHTQYIREIKQDSVVPKKILTTFSEQEFATYENRFLVSLIFRLVLFVEARYNVIKENVESYVKDHINMNSVFNIEGTEVKLDIDMVIRKDQDSDINDHNRALLERIEKLHNMIIGFRGSPFIRSLEKTKRVNPPIIKTNIILKNPDFKNCYTLWLFLDKYSGLFYDVKVKERAIGIEEDFATSVSRLALITYTTVQSNSEDRVEEFKNVSEYEVHRKKLMKVRVVHPDDVIDRPDPINIVDNTVNEFFLTQYRNTFNKKLDENKRNSSTYEIALRKSLREVIAISNALFDSVFDLENEEDIFRRLVNKENPKADYELARRRFQIAKAVRETKEIDYQNTIRLEKRLLKEMDAANNKLIKENTLARSKETRKTYIAKLDKEMKLYLKEKAKIKDKLTAITTEKNAVTKEKQRIQRELKSLTEKTKKEKKLVQQAEQERTKAALKKLEEQNKAKAKKALENKLAKEKAERDRLAKKLAREKEKAALSLQELKKKELAKREAKIAEAKAKNQQKIDNKLSGKKDSTIIEKKDDTNA